MPDSTEAFDKEKLSKKIKDKDALKIVFDIIDSNNKGLFI